MIVATFFAGLLVGTLLGLAVAPLMRAWLTWKSVAELRAEDHAAAPDTTRVET